MGISIMQGDSYQKPFTLRTLDGMLITPEMVTALVLSIGNLSRQYPGDITYADGKWLFPLIVLHTGGACLVCSIAMYAKHPAILETRTYYFLPMCACFSRSSSFSRILCACFNGKSIRCSSCWR